MNVKMNGDEAKAYVDGIYRQVADRWQATSQQLAIYERSGRGKTF